MQKIQSHTDKLVKVSSEFDTVMKFSKTGEIVLEGGVANRDNRYVIVKHDPQKILSSSGFYMKMMPVTRAFEKEVAELIKKQVDECVKYICKIENSMKDF